MHMKIKAYAQTVMYLVFAGAIIFTCLLMEKGLAEFTKSQQQQAQAASDTRDALKNTLKQYENLLVFGVAKLAEENYYSRDRARSLMDQLIQDEADFGNKKLAELMNLFSDY